MVNLKSRGGIQRGAKWEKPLKKLSGFLILNSSIILIFEIVTV